MDGRVLERRRSPEGPDGIFRALADPSRRTILLLLAREDLPLKRIEERFEISRAAVIKHVRILRSCGLVTARKRGRETIHRFNPRPLRAVKDLLSEFDAFWDSHLQKLKHIIESET
jgi:DNA-binding transcriptional ArsR family regulator